MLGPVLEQMNYDLYGPLHEWLFAEGMRHGKYPKPPAAIGKATLRVKYTSILAQAIQAITASSIKQFTDYVGEVLNMGQAASQNPAADKVDFDVLIEEYAKATGVPPNIIRSDADVVQLRDVRQKQQEQQQALYYQQLQQQQSQSGQYAGMPQMPTHQRA